MFIVHGARDKFLLGNGLVTVQIQVDKDGVCRGLGNLLVDFFTFEPEIKGENGILLISYYISKNYRKTQYLYIDTRFFIKFTPF